MFLLIYNAHSPEYRLMHGAEYSSIISIVDGFGYGIQTGFTNHHLSRVDMSRSID